MTPTLPAWLAQVKARRQSISLGDTVSFIRSAGDVPALVKIVEAQARVIEAHRNERAAEWNYRNMRAHKTHNAAIAQTRELTKKVLQDTYATLAAAIKEATDGH